MGLNESKPQRLTSEERFQRSVAVSDMVQQRKAEIDQIQIQVVSDRAIVEAKDMVTFIKVTEKAKVQLDRSGDVLVKADLVAILVALDPSLRSRIDSLEAMRVSDLNAMIRSIIYDPKRVIQSKTSSTLSTSTHQNLLR